MRLWSFHPVYLDSKGLVALWREALLAQKVLAGETSGYKHHPQLYRFRDLLNPEGAIATYLRFVADEADIRGYRFDRSKIAGRRYTKRIPVTDQQLRFELDHLVGKLKTRDPDRYKQLRDMHRIKAHPMFRVTGGPIAHWERR